MQYLSTKPFLLHVSLVAAAVCKYLRSVPLLTLTFLRPNPCVIKTDEKRQKKSMITVRRSSVVFNVTNLQTQASRRDQAKNKSAVKI